MAEFMGDDCQNLIVVTFVMFKQLLRQTDLVSGYKCIRMQVARGGLDQADLICFEVDLFAKILDLLLEIFQLIWKRLANLFAAHAQYREQEDQGELDRGGETEGSEAKV